MISPYFFFVVKISLAYMLFFIHIYSDLIISFRNYKDKEEHINEHNTFRNFVNDIKKEDISNIEFDKKLFEFLNTWILHHIKEVDMKYVDFLKKHLL